MGVLISPLVRTVKDVAGNSSTEVWSIYEYQAANIGVGDSIDLSAFMRRVEYINVTPISGAILHIPKPFASDFPGNAGSGRMEVHRVGGSGLEGSLMQSAFAVSGMRAYIHAFGY